MAESSPSEWNLIKSVGRVPPPRSHFASCVVGEKLFVFGGSKEDGVHYGDFWEYSLETGVWQEVNVLSDVKPSERDCCSFAVCSSQTIYMFGGSDAGRSRRLNDFWKFDIQSQRWTCIHEGTSDNSSEAQGVNGRIPTKRGGHVSSIHSGKFILFGGEAAATTLNDLHVFNMETNTWTEIQPQGVWPSSRQNAAWTKDSKYLYIHGGLSRTRIIADATFKSDFFLLDLETFNWKEMSSHGSAPSRFGHSLCAYGNRFYVYGGRVDAESGYAWTANMYVYNIESGQWTRQDYRKESGPCARGGAAVHIHDNSLYLFGGFDGTDVYNDFYRYRLDPTTKARPATIGRDIQRYVNNKKLADVRFKVEGHEIYAHKIILSSRSEYFDTMLFGGLREGTSNGPIELSGVSHPTFLKVLEFLYSDGVQLESLDEAKDLLVASNMFQLGCLQALCEDWIRYRMSNETVVSILLYSHVHQATGLKQSAMDYLMQNWSDPIVKQRRSDLQADPALIVEVLNHKDLTSKTEP